MAYDTAAAAAAAAAEGDVEAGLQQKTVILVEKKSSAGWMGKLLQNMLLVALCCAGALLLACYWNGGQRAPDRAPPSPRPGRTWQANDSDASPGHTEKLVQRHSSEPHNTLSRISSRAKAAIHLEGKDRETGAQRLEWTKNQGQAFAQGGFQLSNNSILVPRAGLYFVYSQASFQVSCGDRAASGRGPPSLSHRIWRHSDSIGGETSLLSAVRSACQSAAPEGDPGEDQGWYNAIYLGAVFQLKMGDRLRTETNHVSELDTDEGKTFFGVFAL